MGYKTSAILIDRALGSSPEAFVRRLVGTPCSAVRTVTLDEVFYPKATYVGERGTSTIILDPKWPEPILEGGSSPILSRLFEMFPDANIAAVQLHSVTNYAAFRLFRSGTSVRAFMVASDDGVMLDQGEQLEAEARVFAGFKRVASEDPAPRYVDDAGAEWTLDQLGEELVFEIFDDFLGLRPDAQDDLFDMSVTEIAHEKSLWRRLFGGAA